MKRIIFLGPPGSGKGTQAYLIANKYNLLSISAGEILRQSLLCNQIVSTNFNNTIINRMNSGNLVDDELIIKLIMTKINQNSCKNGFILDGFPRNINQAASITKNNIYINFVIEFYISDSVIIDRIIGRQIHVNSGRTYHIKYNPPKHYGLDDVTGEKLIMRKDDNAKTIQQRLNQYHQYTKPLSNYYKKLSNESNLLYFMIDGNHQVTKIYKKLINLFKLHIFQNNTF